MLYVLPCTDSLGHIGYAATWRQHAGIPSFLPLTRNAPYYRRLVVATSGQGLCQARRAGRADVMQTSYALETARAVGLATSATIFPMG